MPSAVHALKGPPLESSNLFPTCCLQWFFSFCVSHYLDALRGGRQGEMKVTPVCILKHLSGSREARVKVLELRLVIRQGINLIRVLTGLV